MKENREVTDTNVEDIEEALEKLSTGKKIKMYELLRTFKREGIENFVTTRKKYVDVILSDYKRVLKENEELKIKNNAIKRESEAYAEHMIRLDNELNLEKEKSKYEWIRQNCLSQELVNKLYIPIQKIKDNIEKEIKYHERNILEIENITMLKSKTAKEEAEIEFNKYAIVVLKKILHELIKEEEENYEENI